MYGFCALGEHSVGNILEFGAPSIEIPANNNKIVFEIRLSSGF